MNAERILIAAECIGDARWFINKATQERKRSIWKAYRSKSRNTISNCSGILQKLRLEAILDKACYFYEEGDTSVFWRQHGEIIIL